MIFDYDQNDGLRNQFRVCRYFKARTYVGACDWKQFQSRNPSCEGIWEECYLHFEGYIILYKLFINFLLK